MLTYQPSFLDTLYLLDLELNILWLLAHCHLGEAREVHHGQAQHVVGVELERDGLWTYSLVTAGYPVCFSLNFFPDLIPVSEHLVFSVEKLSPLILQRN